jgi:hypothetical protein
LAAGDWKFGPGSVTLDNRYSALKFDQETDR